MPTSIIRINETGKAMLSKLSQMKTPLLLCSIILVSLTLGAYIPLPVKSFSYALSLSIKEVIIFILPLMIFSFVFSSMIQMKEEALSFILTILPLVCLSNVLTTILAYVFGKNLISPDMMATTLGQTQKLVPLWTPALPQVLTNDIALLAGILAGLLCAFRLPKKSARWSEGMLKVNYLILNKFIIPVMPVFILGFILKLEYEQILPLICEKYLYILLIICLSSFSFLILSYGALTGFKPQAWLEALKNMFSAALTGFSTMSSAASMPLIILGSEKNVSRPEIVRSVVPSTINIHLIGDSFAIPIMALGIMASLGDGMPDWNTYLLFTLYFVIMKFAVAAVPGGTILIMLPIFEQQLGFSPEMLSLITALYIVFDPIITTGNVLGHGAFAMLFSKVFERSKEMLRKLRPREAQS
jgi:Na+/H+-dicarboxylate symporter